VLKLQDGITTSSQVGVQDEINMHNQKKRAVSVGQMKVMWQI